ncbi:MAG: polysaccharide biosynthesis/export family protein [Acidobacteriota bacterium]|nr:polysaccharide biosynthesis/export family protein [Acidobacteriota bacterium]
MLHTLSLAILIVLQTAAPPQRPDVPGSQSPPQASATYLIGATDVLKIRVFREEQYDGDYNVDGDGTITFPLLGRVAVEGKTTRQIEEDLTKALADGWLNKPQVSVEIGAYRSRSIFVIGEVRQPGRYTIEGPMTLLEVIGQAGSLTPTASDTIIVQRFKDGIAASLAAPPVAGDPRVTEVMRVSHRELQEGRLTANILLQDSDVILVPPADKFYVTGFVRTPGAFPLPPGMTVRQALAVAGGINERGSTRGIKIIRIINGKEVEISASMSDVVRANDTIRVRQRLI